MPSVGRVSISDNQPTAMSPIENTYNLSFQVNGGNIDEQKLAQKVVFEIKKMERSSGAGRRITS
jgi:hypothetical protein